MKTTIHEENLVVAPKVRAFAPRRAPWALAFVVPIALVPFAILVRQAWRTEATLAAVGANGERVVVQELVPGQSLRIPLGSESEAVRIVGHAFGRGSLSSEPHTADLELTVEGRTGGEKRREPLTLTLGGARGRVAAEDPGIEVGEPSGTSVDVAGAGPGEMTLTLRSITAASGVLVRVLRRDMVPAAEIKRRSRQLDDSERDRLAVHAWETSWIDLSAPERDALLGFRWHSVAGVGGAGVSRALVMAPGRLETRPTISPLVWRSSLRRGERSSFIARRDVSTLVSAEAAGTVLRAVVRSPSGEEQRTEATGELPLRLPASASVELESSESTTVTVRAEDPSAIEENNGILAWRGGRGKAIVVTASADPLVLRVSARAPLARESDGATLRVRCTIGPKSFVHTAAVVRSTLDRYEGVDPDAAPSEPTSFYVTVPSSESATLESESDIDLALEELDPKAEPRSIGRPAAEAPQASQVRVRVRGSSSWQGFVARRPTNAGELESRRIRLGRVLAPVARTELPKTVHIRRPRQLPVRTIDEQMFVEGKTVDLDLTTTGEPVSIPIHVKATAPVFVSVEDPTGKKSLASLRRAGLSSWVTVPGEIPGADMRALVIAGDDLAPGPKKLRLTSEAPFALHVPWERRPARPHWSEGDYEP